MNERLGIFVRYRRDPRGRLAVHLAGRLQQRGVDVTLLSPPPLRPFSPYWDQRARVAKRRNRLELVRGCSRVLWTYLPEQAEFRACREAGVKTMLHLDGTHLRREHAASLARFDAVLSPHRCRTTHLDVLCGPEARPVSSPVCGDWSPLDRRKRSGRRALVVFSAEDAESVAGGLGELLSADVRVTLLPCGLSPRETRLLRDRVAGLRRVALLKDPDAEQWRRMLVNHEFIVVSTFQGSDVVAAEAISMGLPVVAWGASPYTEMVVSGESGLLAPCSVHVDWKGAETPTTDAASLLSRAALLAKPRLLRRCQKGACEAALTRSRLFEGSWSRLLNS